MTVSTFDDTIHNALFFEGRNVTNGSSYSTRWSELVLASLKASGMLSILEIQETPPTDTSALWLDERSDPNTLRIYNEATSEWRPVTYDDFFGFNLQPPSSYETRTDFVNDVGARTWENGQSVIADGLMYVASSGATGIPDLPGFVPVFPLAPQHFGENTTPGTTDMKDAMIALRNYIRDNTDPDTWVTVDMRGEIIGIGSTLFWSAVEGVNFTNGQFKATGLASDYPSLDTDPVDGTTAMPGPIITFTQTERIELDCAVECNRVASGIRVNTVESFSATTKFFVHAWAANGYGLGTFNKAGQMRITGSSAAQWLFGETGFDDQANRTGYGFCINTADCILTDLIAWYCKYPIFKGGFGSWEMNAPHGFNGALQTVTDAEAIYAVYIQSPRNGRITGGYFDQGSLFINGDELDSTSATTLGLVNPYFPFSGAFGSNTYQLQIETSVADNDLAGLTINGARFTPKAQNIQFRTTGSGSFITIPLMQADLIFDNAGAYPIATGGNFVISNLPGFSGRGGLVAFLNRNLRGRAGDTVSAGDLFYQFQGAATSISDMPDVVPFGDIHVEHFGAVGDYRSGTDLGTDDTVAFERAFDYMSSIGGGVVNATARYRITRTLDYITESIVLKGVFPERTESSTISLFQRGVIVGDFTDGPVLWMKENDCQLIDMTIGATTTRTSASISTGVGNINCGVEVEREDTPGTLNNIKLENVRILDQPADGLLCEGAIARLDINNTYTNGSGRHGMAITNGQISGRTNTGRPGQININGGKNVDSGGHVLLIGHPNAGSEQPFRVKVENYEGFRGALNASQRFVDAANYVIGADITFIAGSSDGITTGNVPAKPAWVVGGRDINFIGHRFVACQTNYMQIIQPVGFSTQGVRILGGTAVTSSGTPPSLFLSMVNGPDQIEVLLDAHDCLQPITDIVVNSQNDKVILHELDTIQYHNMTVDFGSATRVDVSENPTISSGAITVSGPGYYVVDTEGDAATDDLDTINGGVEGMVIYLKQQNSGRVITLTRTGNIRPDGASDFTFSGSNQIASFIYDGTDWRAASPVTTT